MKFRLIVPLSLATISFIAPSAHAQQAEELATQVCASCHGPNGDSVSSAFPKLAAQKKEYLEGQLRAFRDRTRADPMAQAYMWGMSSQLSDEQIRELAAYYAGRPAPRGRVGDPKLIQLGRSIFEQGIPREKVQACVTCHGKDAAGNATFPRLAGQHAEYLVKQLVLFKSQLRADVNAAIMHNVSGGMSFDQMEAVAAYLASR